MSISESASELEVYLYVYLNERPTKSKQNTLHFRNTSYYYAQTNDSSQIRRADSGYTAVLNAYYSPVSDRAISLKPCPWASNASHPHPNIYSASRLFPRFGERSHCHERQHIGERVKHKTPLLATMDLIRALRLTSLCSTARKLTRICVSRCVSTSYSW